jgi:PilZ domain
VQIAKVPRATIRFPLEAPVAFRWTDENGTRQQGEGSSRDISEHGAFVFAAACPPVGSNVELRIPLEGLPDATGIDVQGSVIRVERPAEGIGSSGFAVKAYRTGDQRT